MISETQINTEPVFKPQDIEQAQFSDKDLQKISDIAEKSFKNKDYLTENQFRQLVSNHKNDSL